MPENQSDFQLGRTNPREQDVPGYESLLRELLGILKVHGDSAAVSGVILTGCAGVGKTRMASCFAQHYIETLSQKYDHKQEQSFGRNINSSQLSSKHNVYFLSIQDLIFQASVETNILDNVLVPKLQRS